MLAELYRVLAPGGRLWLTAPLFYAEHQTPYDFYRYTQYGMRHVLEYRRLRGGSLEWMEGYLGTLSYQLRVMSKVLPASRQRLRRRAAGHGGRAVPPRTAKRLGGRRGPAGPAGRALSSSSTAGCRRTTRLSRGSRPLRDGDGPSEGINEDIAAERVAAPTTDPSDACRGRRLVRRPRASEIREAASGSPKPLPRRPRPPGTRSRCRPPSDRQGGGCRRRRTQIFATPRRALTRRPGPRGRAGGHLRALRGPAPADARWHAARGDGTGGRGDCSHLRGRRVFLRRSGCPTTSLSR